MNNGTETGTHARTSPEACEEANACLGRYARFIKGLPACESPLGEEERATTTQLQKFFTLLKQIGEAERRAPCVDDD